MGSCPWGERLTLATAHEFKTCREMFPLTKSIVERPGFEQHGPNVYTSNGKESIQLANGSRIMFIDLS